MKHILVTGGCGFIGSNLCIQLWKDESNIITCVDNLITGKRENITSLEGQSRFTFLEHDIVEILPAFTSKIDEIYHLACPASPPQYQKDPLNTLRTNFLGTWNVLECARVHEAKVLFTSTSEVYGEPQCSPQMEEYRGNVTTTGIRSCYDEGKRVAETLMMDYHKTYHVPISIARVFNTYGPYMDEQDGRVISNLIFFALRGLPLPIFGNGKQTRTFCYIDDQVEGLVRLMKSNYHLPVNIGHATERTVLEVAVQILSLTESLSILEYRELPSDDPSHRRPDLRLCQQILGWTPSIPLNEGLWKTIQYFKKRL